MTKIVCSQPSSYEGTQIVYTVLFHAEHHFPWQFDPIQLPLFCKEIHGLCFYRLFHWDLDSVRFSFPGRSDEGLTL